MKFKRMFLVLIVVFMLLSVPCSYALNDTNDSFNINSSNLDIDKEISNVANGSDFPYDPTVPIPPTKYLNVNIAIFCIKYSQMNWKAVYWDELDRDRTLLCVGVYYGILYAHNALHTYKRNLALDFSKKAVMIANNMVWLSYKL